MKVLFGMALRQTTGFFGPKRLVWRKIHLGIDAKTLEIRAVEVISSKVGNAPMLPELLSQNPADQEIASVTADGTCDTESLPRTTMRMLQNLPSGNWLGVLQHPRREENAAMSLAQFGNLTGKVSH